RSDEVARPSEGVEKFEATDLHRFTRIRTKSLSVLIGLDPWPSLISSHLLLAVTEPGQGACRPCGGGVMPRQTEKYRREERNILYNVVSGEEHRGHGIKGTRGKKPFRAVSNPHISCLCSNLRSFL